MIFACLRLLRWSILFLSLTCISSFSQVTTKKVDLKESASSESKTTLTLPENSKVTILQRTGFWVRATAEKSTGWLKVTDLRFSNDVSGRVNLSSVDSGRTGTNNIVSTSAARGLSAKELSEATPDFAAVRLLTSMSRNEELLRKFRAEGGLEIRQIAVIAPSVSNTKPATSTKADNNEW